MAETIKKLIPSMFKRRLLLLFVLTFFISGLLALQLVRLTLVEGHVKQIDAESALMSGYVIPTLRGQILDRKGVVLAQDRASYDLAVNYSVISGDWAYRSARHEAIVSNRQAWAEMDYEDREHLIAELQVKYDAQVSQLWETLCQVGKISREELEKRKNDIRSRVMQIASHVWMRLKERRSTQLDEDVQMSDVSTEIEEQKMNHDLLFSLDNDGNLRLDRLISDARSAQTTAKAAKKPIEPSVWTLVEVVASRERIYPQESQTVSIHRSSVPGPSRRPTPLQIPLEGIASHLVGSMRKVWSADLESRPFMRNAGKPDQILDLGGYLSGDKTGAWGLERAEEERLRGIRGQVMQNIDTNEEKRREPLPGLDVRMSIDIKLQAKIQGIMDPRDENSSTDPGLGLMRVQPWQSKDPTANPLHPQLGSGLNGAAIVLDIASGEVLAAVSMPSMSLKTLKESPGTILNDDLNQPYLNRVVAQRYQPGSTVKPLVLSGAITDGKLGLDEKITCTGFLDKNDQQHFRCWIYKTFHDTHGPLGGSEAIARSCNIFFYTLGRRLGPQRLSWWYEQYGLGRSTGSGMPEEIVGDLPDETGNRLHRITPLSIADGTFMAIGQGPIQWTPIQAANAYATLARGGIAMPTTFIHSTEAHEVNAIDLHLDPRGVKEALEGMDQAINQSYGSGNHLALLNKEPIINLTGVKVIGKSGTADAPPLRAREDGQPPTSADPIVREGDHSWFVTLVQRPGSSRPNFVVIVVVEFGGSGGNVAGPVVNQILHAMREEGYI